MHRLYIHPLPVRIWHWVNAVTCVMLVLTAVQIRYVGLINVVSFRVAVAVHNWLGFILIANFFVWFLFYVSRSVSACSPAATRPSRRRSRK